MSRFAMPKSEQARLDRMSDPGISGSFDEDDPKSVANYMRKMGREMGDELADPEFDEAVDEIERGGLDGDSDDGGVDNDE